MKKAVLWGVVSFLFALTSCNRNNGQNEAAEISYNGDTVTVNSTSPICGKIKLATIVEESFSEEFRTVGTAQAETGKYAEICTPFDGRVTNALVRLGNKVSAGQGLFEISSSDFLETSKEYFQASTNYEKVEADYQRKKTLFEHGLTSKRELDEAFAEAENARKDKESAEATLRVFNMNPSSIKMGQPLRVCSPISGEVVASNITPGKFIKADDEAIATIADLSTMWVNALIKERYISTVTLGGQAEIFTESEPDNVIWGKVINVGSVVDEETRSVQVLLGCDNADRKLKHGMYVSVHFMSEPHPAIVLPSTAVFQGEQSSFVFVATDKPNTYIRRQVVVSTSSDDNQKICVRSGLTPGERVISEGGIYLAD